MVCTHSSARREFSVISQQKLEVLRMDDSRATPVRAWIILSIAIIAVSSAGAVFKMMGDITPILRASWRLQATSVILFPMFIWQMKATDFQWNRSTVWIIIGSGICLWIHFASWVWSLDHTSLTHSLLFVTAHPLIIVGGMFILRMDPHRWEVWGAVVGAVSYTHLTLPTKA